MQMHPRATVVAAAILSVSSIAPAHDVSFEMITDALSANDMSPDGRYIVGSSDFNGDGGADGLYLLDTELNAMTSLPPEGLKAVAVSDDGSVVLGDIPDPQDPDPALGTVAARWTRSTGFQSLGYLPEALECPSRSNGYELSADGTVAVGLSWDGCSGRGFRWTAQTGMVELQPLANGSNRASVVSADGSLIGGFAQGSGSRTPAIWDANGGGELLDPPNGDALGEIHGMNDAGTILLGTWLDDPGVLAAQAVKWTPGPAGWSRELIGAGSLLPGWQGIPMDIADDGTIVGFDILLGNRRAWIQPGGSGPLIELRTFIETSGGTVPGGLLLEVCQAISADGRYIIGHGFGSGAWRVTIAGDVACGDWPATDGAGCFTGPGAGPLPAGCETFDFDHDDDGDLMDFAAFQRFCPYNSP
ncbi:MAG: hypothetical protein GY778_20370 [bacterium]|nr:hypothetical protein [bacterium]